jgi:hypothetical protein
VGIPVIRDGGEPAVAVHGEPGAPGLQVPPADDIAVIGPPTCRLRRSLVKFIAIARYDQG